ncbi:MAG: hypothetical protein AAF799_36395 [Myxococcota bacterium]
MTRFGSVWRAGVLGLWVCALACGGSESKPEGDAGEPTSDDPRAALDQARTGLADPQRYPFRDGLKINEEALRATLMQLRERHGAQVAVAYAASIEALPTGDAPTAPQFEELAAFALPDDPAARDVEAMNWLFDRDVEETVRRSLSTYLALLSQNDLEMPIRDVGVWFAFLRAAEPTLKRCSPSPDDLWLCLDYGADVFVFELSRLGSAWIVRKLRWHQQPSTANDH